MKRPRTSSGFTVMEVVFGLMLLGVLALVLGRTSLFINKHENDTQEKELANEICLQLMQEVRAYSEVNTVSDIDSLDDNTRFNSTLSISGSSPRNFAIANRYCRQVNVFTVEGEPQARRVRVRVYRRGTPSFPVTGTALLAETTGFVRKTSKTALSIQNLRMYRVVGFPSYPVYNSPTMKMDTRNISLVHAGRLPEGYSPRSVHHRTEPAYDWNYTDIVTTSVYLTNNSDVNGSVDAYNHGTRQPTCSLGAPDCLRALLDRMILGDADYRNVLIVNAGGVFYLPPIRNYSDAARDSGTIPYARAVTHPERIGVASGAEIKLRVYTYTMRPDLPAADTPLPEVTIVLSTNVPDANIAITKISGDSANAYTAGPAAVPADARVDVFASSTVIHLFNSPQRHPYHHASHTGLRPNRRLYGLEYIPCPVKDGDWYDLTTDSDDEAKNTARWIIRLAPGSVPDGLFTATTRIGDDLTTGTFGNKPADKSVTYVWSGVAVPMTEQYQFIGDPRHMPYMDVKQNHGYNWFFVRVNNHGYEGFDKTHDGWVYQHQLPNVNTTEERVNFDFPRYMQVIRTALLNSNSLYMVGDSSLGRNESYTPMAFASFGGGVTFEWTRLGVTPLKAPVNAWDPNNSGVGYSFELGADRTNVNSYQRIIARTDNTWMSLPWLGELFPDESSTTWNNIRNLYAVPGGFYRAPYSVFASTIGLPAGTNFSMQIGGAALGTLLNGNTGGAGNNYVYMPYLGGAFINYNTTWKTIENLFQIYMGRPSDNTTANIDLNAAGNPTRPPAYNDAPYSGERTRVTVVRRFMDQRAGKETAALIRMEDPGNAARVGYVVANTNENNDWNYELGAVQDFAMAAWGFLEMGSPLEPLGVQPIPRVSFVAPLQDAVIQNPTTVAVQWNREWLRADGGAYTPDYPNNYTHAGAVIFNLMYSDNNGWSWKDVATNANRSPAQRAQANNVTSPYNWDVSALPAGRYVLRIEAFRAGEQHNAYHDRRIEIKR